ncbi:RagB/SusD family nutrient uptake outer membrane protein [Chitinophaga caseinilytica]|uniref:RagB/SusD family nutrient uptake outer membrane protein n=1 Tax=Chitinophaga caseinilytica TaxID=2267521 RepID=UPI003C2E4AB7
MKRFVILTLLAATAAGFNACKDYLNVVPDNAATIDYAFRNRLEAENYLFTCYNTLQQLGNVVQHPAFTTSGEIALPLNTPRREFLNDIGFTIITGGQNITEPILNYWDGANSGRSMFTAIRQCNIMLDNIHKPIDLSGPERSRWTGEVKFLKAYYHYWLLRMYGPIPLIRKNAEIDATTEEVRVRREHVDTAFNYIVSLLDEAIPDLPEKIAVEGSEMGRITKNIARAVKAEVRVTQASPLYNGNPDYARVKNKDGQLLFSTTADPKKWETAATACREAITAAEAANYRLYSFVPPGNLGTVSDQTKRVLAIQGAVTFKWNEEMIWALNLPFSYQQYAAARLPATAQDNYQLISRLPSNINTAELFYTNNGVPIDEDRNWDYARRFNPTNGNADNKFYVREGYTTAGLNLYREPRYYANLGFDGGIWFGNGVLTDASALHVEAKLGQTAGVMDGFRYNATGYWPKKLVHYKSVYDKGVSITEDYPWPMFRLAALYLLYAEALNESAGPSDEAYDYINRVRVRAGLKTVQESWAQYSRFPNKYTTQAGLRAIIQQERRIELCFEGQAGWDLRRWKTLANVMSKPIRGWDINKETATGYYRPQSIITPVFQTKDYFWPLRDRSLSVNPNLVQNAYW